MDILRYFILPLVLLACVHASPAGAGEARRTFPAPQTVSLELQKLIAAEPFSYWNDHPQNAQEWKIWAETLGREGAKGLADLRKHLGVFVTQGTMGGYVLFQQPLQQERRGQTLLRPATRTSLTKAWTMLCSATMAGWETPRDCTQGAMT